MQKAYKQDDEKWGHIYIAHPYIFFALQILV